MEYFFPGYIWITYAGSFTLLENSSIACNLTQLESVVDGLFTIGPALYNETQMTRDTFVDINSVS